MRATRPNGRYESMLRSSGRLENHVTRPATRCRVVCTSLNPQVCKDSIGEGMDFHILGSDGIWDALKERFMAPHPRKGLRTTAQPRMLQKQ